jgi:hypothetical protein
MSSTKSKIYRFHKYLYRRFFAFTSSRYMCLEQITRKKKSHFYLYHEEQTKRRPSEIWCLLLVYIPNHVYEATKELHVICNSYLTTLWSYSLQRYLLMGDSTKNVITFLSVDAVVGTLNLLRKVLHKIDRVYSPEEYWKLIEQSSRKGKFSIIMCNNFSTQYKWW